MSIRIFKRNRAFSSDSPVPLGEPRSDRSSQKSAVAFAQPTHAASKDPVALPNTAQPRPPLLKRALPQRASYDDDTNTECSMTSSSSSLTPYIESLQEQQRMRQEKLERATIVVAQGNKNLQYAAGLISNASSTSSMNTSLVTALSHQSSTDTHSKQQKSVSFAQDEPTTHDAVTESSDHYSSSATIESQHFRQSSDAEPQTLNTALLSSSPPKRASTFYNALSLSPQKKSPARGPSRKISTSFNPHSNYFTIEVEEQGSVTKLEYIKTLGHGSQSRVHLCRLQRMPSACVVRLFQQQISDTGSPLYTTESQFQPNDDTCAAPVISQLVAVKVLHRSQRLGARRKSISVRHQSPMGLSREIAILRRISHPNIVELIDVIDDPDLDKVFLVFSYVDGGAVLNLDEDGFVQPMPRTMEIPNECFFTSDLDDRPSLFVLQEEHARRYMSNLVDGLIYLHSRHLIHRDIKPENLLIDEKTDRLIISDFGLASHFVGTDAVVDSEGSPAFCSPERCSIFTEMDASYAAKGTMCDIWAAGVCLYTFLHGRVPFVGTSTGAEFLISLYRSIQCDEPVLSRHLSEEARDLLRRILEKDPVKRISLQEIRHHPWLDKRLHPQLITQADKESEMATQIRSEHAPSALRSTLNLLNAVRKNISRIWNPRHKDKKRDERPKSHSGIFRRRMSSKVPSVKRNAKSLVLPQSSQNNTLHM